MSILRSLRAYIGLGPDEEYEDSYLYDLDLRSDDLDGSEISQAVEDMAFAGDAVDFDDMPIGLADDAADADVRMRTVGGVGTRSRRKAGSSSSTGRPRRAGSRRPGLVEKPRVEDDAFDPREDSDTGLSSGSDAVSSSDSESNEEQASSQVVSDSESDEITDGVVRSLAKHRSRPRTISPRTFADSKVLADEFIRGVPIVLDLRGEGRELSRRLIDFASGVCYALDGQMEKVSSQVFLLIPADASVTDEDRALIEEGGYIR